MTENSIARGNNLMYNPRFRNPVDAFDDAIASGRLNTRPESSKYAGNWMYMHTDEDGKDVFKNIETRRYDLE